MEHHDVTFRHKHSIELSHPPHNSISSYHFVKNCIICEKRLHFEYMHFHCRVCDFRLHKECYNILLSSSQTVNHPETHSHTLTFIRKMNTFNCAACGEVYKDKMNMYGCLLCNFFVHKNCIYLPKVIKLTCHSHYLLHTFQVLVNKKSCQICNQPLVYEYGGYICAHKSCDYKLHSYCATSKEVWDGKDVEQVPEEASTSEEVALSSLVDIDSKTSRHFSHPHNLMRLCVNDEVEDGGICQACVLPIDFGSFLSCKECVFALHNTCAKLPRKMEHTFHRHPLNLEVNLRNIRAGFFYCSKCVRASCGFMYRCYQKYCEFKMDATCASLSDPLYNIAHEHPLHLTNSGARCNQCDIKLKPKRVTLPVLVKHKYDTHPLTLGFAESIRWSGLSCVICEVKIEDAYPWSMGLNPDLYGCTECKTIICVECAIGKYPYLKPGITIKVNDSEFDTTSSFSLSRPICHACQEICQDKLVFKNKRVALFFCSIKCIISSQ